MPAAPLPGATSGFVTLNIDEELERIDREERERSVDAGIGVGGPSAVECDILLSPRGEIIVQRRERPGRQHRRQPSDRATSRLSRLAEPKQVRRQQRQRPPSGTTTRRSSPPRHDGRRQYPSADAAADAGTAAPRSPVQLPGTTGRISSSEAAEVAAAAEAAAEAAAAAPRRQVGLHAPPLRSCSAHPPATGRVVFSPLY